MGRNAFIDPATGFTYTWRRNHDTEEQGGRTRTITELPAAAAAWDRGAQINRQQGQATPKVLRLRGTASPDQHFSMTEFEELSELQTIIFEHACGDRYEVLVGAYEVTRKAVVDDGHGNKIAFDYSLDLEVVRTL